MLTLPAGFSVQTEDLHAAAGAFARLHGDAADLLKAGGFAGTGGMAGRDPVLAPWRARYDAIAAAEWAASATAVTTLGAIATKLTDTANTYLAADDAATRADPPDASHRGCRGRTRTAARWRARASRRGRTRLPIAQGRTTAGCFRLEG
jgi:hypothetical protein